MFHAPFEQVPSSRLAASAASAVSIGPFSSCRSKCQPSSCQKSCLWKVVSKDSTVYLLGSVHLLKSDAYPLSQAIERAFGDSTKLVLEVNLDSLNSPDAQQMILAKALLPEGKTLNEVLSPATYQAVRQKVEGLGLDIEALKRMKPWFLSLSLVAMKMQQLGYDAQHGVDRHFFERARKAKKEVLGLETADFQSICWIACPPRPRRSPYCRH